MFTGSQAYAFAKDSLLVTRDVSVFIGSTVSSKIWELCPPNVQKQVLEQYDDVFAKVDTLRLQNGLPTPASLYKDVESEYYKKVDPVVQKGLEVFEKAAEKPFVLVKKFIAAFEEAYPEQAGKLTTGSVFDFLLVAFFLLYFVFSYFYRCFCYFCCCGCCARRSSPPKPKELIKPGKGASAKTNGVAKKKN